MNLFKKEYVYQRYTHSFSNRVNARPNESFPGNSIQTSKYNVVTFLPKSLILQFKRLANIYFLIIAILQTIPIISPFGPFTAWAPFIIVLGISMLRQGYQDYLRHKSDNQLNSNPCTKLIDGQWKKSNWTQIVVGDFVRCQADQFFPADMLVLTSSLPKGVCYIQTGALDGQKNLKPKSSQQATLQYFNKDQFSKAFEGVNTCQNPNPELYKYKGELKMNDEKSIRYVNAKSLLLRGAKLKNTHWVVGLVIYTGENTRIMKNSDEPRDKLSQIQLQVNYLLLFIFFFQLALCILCSVGDGVFYSLNYSKHAWYIPGPAGNNTISEGVLNFFSHVVLFNTMIPISLVVSIEVVKMVQAIMMQRDVFLYSPQKQKKSKVLSSSLNQQLGQIEYIFSDKTGTLTCNVMEFKLCVLADQLYGDTSCLQLQKTSPPKKLKYTFQDPALQDIVFRSKQVSIRKPVLVTSKDKSKSTQFKTVNELAVEYFTCLSLAHQCMRQESKQHPGQFKYEGPSPDQITLVQAARCMRYEFIESTSNSKVIEINKQKKIVKLLMEFPFDSDRKRMSIIVQIDGVKRMYTKGADSIVKKRLQASASPFQDSTDKYLTQFSSIGLRTLLIAMKYISDNEYRQFVQKLKTVDKLPQNQQDQAKNNIVSDFQMNLYLIGATAVQDKLQPNLSSTISDLILANIKIWMLTGDKMETAQNIAKSCSLIQPHFAVFRYQNKRPQEINSYLDKQIEDIFSQSKKGAKISYLLEGQNLTHILHDSVSEEQLVEIAKLCDVVVCCRVSPKQKAQVVSLVKRKLNKITLAIGDGANDVNMIMEAHIGVGLYGNQGMRAVQSADYALPEFQYLWRLLLFHGRFNYLRISEMILYFFYKNMVFTIPQFYFAFYCGFSGQTFFDQVYVSLFNLVFTSLPLIIKAILEQDINYIVRTTVQNSSRGLSDQRIPSDFRLYPGIKKIYPRYYYIGQKSTIFNGRNFIMWVFEGMLAGLVITLWSIYCLEGNIINTNGVIADYDIISVTAYSSVIVVVTIKLATHTRFWSWAYFFTINIFGLVIYFIWLFISMSVAAVQQSIIVYLTVAQTYMVVIFCTCLLLFTDGLLLYLRDNYLDEKLGAHRLKFVQNPDYLQIQNLNLDEFAKEE